MGISKLCVGIVLGSCPTGQPSFLYLKVKGESHYSKEVKLVPLEFVPVQFDLSQPSGPSFAVCITELSVLWLPKGPYGPGTNNVHQYINVDNPKNSIGRTNACVMDTQAQMCMNIPT